MPAIKPWSFRPVTMILYGAAIYPPSCPNKWSIIGRIRQMLANEPIARHHYVPSGERHPSVVRRKRKVSSMLLTGESQCRPRR